MADKETNKVCEQLECNSEPTHKVFWPGKIPAKMCVSCALKTQLVGDAIGCYVPIEVISGSS